MKNDLKLGPLPFSFGVSLACHAVVFGVVALAAFNQRGPMVRHEEPPLTVNLIAAPMEAPAPASEKIITAVVPVSIPVAPVVPVAPVPIPPEPVKGKIVEAPVIPEVVAIPVLPEPTLPTKPEPPMTPTPAPAPPIIARGDGSSPQPGPDATTTVAQPGIVAHPNYLQNPDPPYPKQAKLLRQQGLVLLAVIVTAQGRAKEISIKESSGYSLLDTAALNAVRDWKFEPARVGTIPIESKIEVPVRFRLSR